jgi:SnoaL-like domain
MLTIEQRLQHLEDEAAIRELASRFADAVTRADHKTLRSLWKPDGVFMIGEPHAVTCKGIDEIDALIGKLRDGKDFFVQFVHGGLVHVDDNKASARWLMREIGSGPGKSGQDYYNNFGFFIDELEKVDGTWLFESRTYPYLYLDTDSFTGKGIPLKTAISFA